MLLFNKSKIKYQKSKLGLRNQCIGKSLYLVGGVFFILGITSLSVAVEKGEDASWLGVPELKGKVSLVILTNPYAPQFRSFVQTFDPSPFQQSGRQMFMVVDQGMSSKMPSMSAVLQSTVRETPGIGNATFEHNIAAYPAYLVIDSEGKVYSVRMGAVNMNDLVQDMASIPQGAKAAEKIVLEMGESNLRLEYLELSAVGEQAEEAELKEESRAVFTLNVSKFMESLYVDAQGRVSNSISVLEQGKKYRVKAMGFVTLGAAVAGKYIVADAGYVFQADQGTSWGNQSLPAPSGTLAITGQGMKPREPYHPTHEYTQDVDGTGGVAELKVEDSEYDDNGGRLLIHIERLLGFKLVRVSSAQNNSAILEAQKWGESLRWDEAISVVEKSLSQFKDDFTLWNFLGVLYLKRSESESTEGVAIVETSPLGQAFSSLQNALRLNNQSAAIHNNMGVAYRKSGDRARAQEEFKKALGLESNFEPASYNLALLEEEDFIRLVSQPGSPGVSSPQTAGELGGKK